MAKTFVLSDDSLNSYGFRTLTAGINIEQFKKNPIMLFMHNRPWRGTKEEYTVIGRWENIRKENGQLLADAVFDLNDPFAKGIADKVENNFLRMASLGFNPIETSNDEKYILPGQRYETVTKSLAKEASIVDIGANSNSLALCDVPALYNENQELLTLAEGDASIIPLLNLQNNDMSTLKDIAAQFKLADNATAEQVVDAIKAQNQELLQLKADKDGLEGKVTTLTDKVKELENAATASKIEAMLTAAVDAKKITEAEKPKYMKLAQSDFETTKEILDGKPAYNSIAAQLKDEPLNDAQKEELKGLLELSSSQLFTTGKFDRLKQLSESSYKQRYKEYFGKEAPEDKA